MWKGYSHGMEWSRLQVSVGRRVGCHTPLCMQVTRFVLANSLLNYWISRDRGAAYKIQVGTCTASATEISKKRRKRYKLSTPQKMRSDMISRRRRWVILSRTLADKLATQETTTRSGHINMFNRYRECRLMWNWGGPQVYNHRIPGQSKHL